MGSNVEMLDALIVGAGFGGIYQLKRLRDEGYNVKLVDFASDYGGTWYWNRYPGARVDSDIPFYEYSDPSLWKEFMWKSRFPGSAEMREYFAFVAEKWDLRKDTDFNTFISGAQWNEAASSWSISTKDNNKTYQARFLLLNTGFAAKRYTPDWDGVNKFAGTWLHTSFWPKQEPDIKGKKVALIGTGATGVQVAEALNNVAGELVVFQRTPNFALPMKQVLFTGEEQAAAKKDHQGFLEQRKESFTGFSFTFLDRNTFDDDKVNRRATYEKLWAYGDLHYWLGTYKDMLFTDEANLEAYNFWKEKVRARIHDKSLWETLAPEVAPHSFGCKQTCLERQYYEIFNKPHVSLVDVNKTPVVSVTERGIRTTEKEWDFDYIICATGFDAGTGGLTQIDIRGPSGETLGEKWDKGGLKSHLGLAVAGFPNMFYTYGPQAPTGVGNGPTCAEYQGDFILQAMNTMREKGLRRVEADKTAEEEWSRDISALANTTLFPGTKSVRFTNQLMLV